MDDMDALQVFYTPRNCQPAYQLNWSLTIYWKSGAPDDSSFVPVLTQELEYNGIRLLEYRLAKTAVSQFWLSTKPYVAPVDIVRQVKGRLQHIVRPTYPKALRRNYYLTTVGSARREVIENYIAAQHEHHKMADELVQQELTRYDFVDPRVDLSAARTTNHGCFMYNLHLVLVNLGRRIVISEEILTQIYNSILLVAGENQHLLRRMSVVPDHTHFALGCHMHESPESVALHYMNRIACALGYDLFQYGYYVGTFGEYDIRTMRRKLGL